VHVVVISLTSRPSSVSRLERGRWYLNNVGIRKIARFTGVSPPAVLKWIRKAAAALAERLSATETV
jgi:transposase-like protein